MLLSDNKYLRTALMETTGQVGDNPLFAVYYLLRFLRAAVLLSVWRIVFVGDQTVSGMSLETVLTYTLIAEAFRQPLECRDTGVGTALWEGSIATRMLRPMGLFTQFATEMMGRWLFGFAFFSTPLLLIAPVLGVNPLPPNLQSALLFPVSLVLSVSVGLALEFIFGAVVFLSQSVYLASMLRDATVTLLSGALIPLALLPWGLGSVFEWTPFASMASAPLQIYTGTDQALLLIVLQATWSIVLWPLAFYLWTTRRERLVTYGG